MDLPFDGAISQFYRNEAPAEIRKRIEPVTRHADVAATGTRIAIRAVHYDIAWGADLWDA